ncbi:hypothetical protein GCM10007047_01020 [Cerasicoccus arenae]|uniref:DUF481 domain-containing protein n=1 Tax=Cerasicoccus arenae TaxID=424488 RepID=A0A8J3GCQ1_9BACT|nr:hypothetical protein GCM10007047_01020 [Cerasicoccus arenae]
MDEAFDWIELTSGEWLKGTFRYMYNDSVEFDSDKLGVLTIDWSDIKEVRFGGPMGVRLDNRTVHRGRVTLDDGEMHFTETGETVKRDKVVSIAPVAHDEWDRWELNAKIGADYQTGNTNETSYTGAIELARRTATTRLKLSYIGNYSETDDVESANNHRVSSSFDYFFDERIFVRPFDGEYYRDPFQNLNMQLTLGAGIGYKLVDTKKMDWEIQIGPAYQYTVFSTVQPGEDSEAQSPAALFTTTFDADITDDLTYKLNYQATLTNRASGLLTQHLVTSLEYEITTIFDVFIMLQVDRVEDPMAKADGSVPSKNDVTLSLGLGVDI